MAEIKFEKPEVNLVTDTEVYGGRAVDPDDPFRICLLGDWRGRGSRGRTLRPSEIAKAKSVIIDRDNFDDVMAAFSVEIELALRQGEDSAITLSFSELDDFHPDRIYESHPLFAQLRELREQVDDPLTYLASVKKLTRQTEAAGSSNAAVETVPVPVVPSSDSSGSLLDQMLDDSSSGDSEEGVSATPAGRKSDFGRFLDQVVRPHLAPDDDPEREEMVTRVDDAISSVMRAILHDPEFQRIEAAWRGINLLVRGLETNSQLELCLVDVTKGDLVADFAASENYKETSIYDLLVEQTVGTPEAETWALVCGNYFFDASDADVRLLSELGKVAASAGAPLLAGAGSGFYGLDEDGMIVHDPSGSVAGLVDWASLRHSSQAAHVGLALPRFLLRMPYGNETDSLESFDFEEFAEPTEHDSYLWGNGAFACAFLLARGFTESGWNLRPDEYLEMESLPLHLYEVDGESRLKPCAEGTMTERTAEAFMESGIMPLLSIRGTDQVRFARFQSIANPLQQLKGGWLFVS